MPHDYERLDFTVVVQPFMSGAVHFPKTTINDTEVTDQSYFAPDCFHFSRKGHSIAAAALWGNLFQDLNRKNSTFDFSQGDLSCPDDNCPYIRTWANSRNCSAGVPKPVIDWTTLLPILENITLPDWNITENFTGRSHHDRWTGSWTDLFANVTWPPHFTKPPNFTGSWADIFANFTRPPHFTGKWSDILANLTRRPHPHWTGTWPATWPYPFENVTFSPYQRMMQVPEAGPTYSVASAGWVAFGIILAVAVVGMAIVGYVDLKKRQRQTYRDERTPLLTGSNVERIY